MVNNFTHVRYGNPDHRLISRKDQVNHIALFSSCSFIKNNKISALFEYMIFDLQARMIYSLMKQKQRPIAYDRHVYFIDFQNICKKCNSPTWIRYLKCQFYSNNFRIFSSFNKGPLPLYMNSNSSSNSKLQHGPRSSTKICIKISLQSTRKHISEISKVKISSYQLRISIRKGMLQIYFF